MNITIVTTTINAPTEATIKFGNIARERGWKFIVVGDQKTPHTLYEKDSRWEYLHPNKQDELFPDLSEMLGWRTIQRRNIGFAYAYQQGADIVATVDDDNIPYADWGVDLYVGSSVEANMFYSNTAPYFDPLSVTNNSDLWHRGYPVKWISRKNDVVFEGKKVFKPLIQADLWDGDPDIDATLRLTKQPMVKFNNIEPFTARQYAPFNSQNTFIHREVLPYYCCLPGTGRMDDIWGAYLVQQKFPNSVLFNRASVYQRRNVQDLVKNLENETLGYRYTEKLLEHLIDGNDPMIQEFMPEKTRDFYDLYVDTMLKIGK